MEIKEVINQVKEIKKVAYDPEEAHWLEDILYEKVLDEIASGKCSDPKAFAKEALKTKDFYFPRWCS